LRYAKKAIATDAKELEDLLENWKAHRIRLPHWMAPYFCHTDDEKSIALCTRHNHVRGNGCTIGKSCKFDDRCCLCGSKDHGAFWPDGESAYRCAVHNKLNAELDTLAQDVPNASRYLANAINRARATSE
jgi:hypothetical protein